MMLFSQIFAITCSMILPFLFALYLCIKQEGKWKILLAGALSYVLFEMAIYLPALSILSHIQEVNQFIQANPAGYVLLISIIQPLLAEAFRLLIISIFIRNDTTFYDALTFGIGYGGIACALSIGMNVLVGLITHIDEGSVNLSNLLLAQGIGQLCLLVLQVGYTLLIMKTIATKKKKYFWIGTGIEILVALMSNFGQTIFHLNIWIVLVGMLFFSLGIGFYIIQVGKGQKNRANSYLKS